MSGQEPRSLQAVVVVHHPKDEQCATWERRRDNVRWLRGGWGAQESCMVSQYPSSGVTGSWVLPACSADFILLTIETVPVTKKGLCQGTICYQEEIVSWDCQP
jgi:hypothetical protein